MRILAMFAASFAAAVFFAQSVLPCGWLLPLAGACAVLFAAGFLLRGARRARRARLMLISAGLCFGLLWCRGYAALFFAPAEALDGETAAVSALVLDYPQATEYGIRVTVKIERENADIRTLLYADDAYAVLKPGDRVGFTACFQLADRLRGEEVRYYTAKGVYLLANLRGDMEVSPGTGLELRFAPVRLSHALGEAIGEAFDAELSPFFRALVLGDRSGFSDSFETALSRSGLSHTVAVSGMHISILVGIVLRLCGNRRRAALLAIPPVLFFMGMVGGTPSVARAAVMQILLLTAPLLRREDDPPTTLSFALLVILLQNPYSIGSIGLQLSFASMAGILLFSEKIYERVDEALPGGRSSDGKKKKRRNILFRVSFATLSSTLGAMVFTVPLTAIYFDTVSLIAPLSNLLALWAVSLAFLGGLLAGTAALVWLPLGRLLALPAVPLGWYLTKSIPLFSKPTFAAVSVQSGFIRGWLIFSYLLLVIWLLRPDGRRRPLVPAALCVAGLCAALLLSAAEAGSSKLTAAVLDVGQGQSVVLQSGGHTVLVDCGGSDAGDMAADYVQGTGQNRIDLLVLTHYHEDHANGLNCLFARIDVAAAAVPDVDEDSPQRAAFLALAEEQGTQIYWIEEDSVFSMDELKLTVYAPLGSGGGNEEGLAVLGSAGDFDVLLTGDMSAFVEKMLVKYGRLPDVEALVVGHHGSKYATSEELLRTVEPEIAVISVGWNRFGHPAEETLGRLADEGISIFRTDTMGTVTVRSRD